MTTASSIGIEERRDLEREVDALDKLPLSLIVLEQMLKLIADRFGVPITTGHRVIGEAPRLRRVLDCTRRKDARLLMAVSIGPDGRYHCAYIDASDKPEEIKTTTSAVAWSYVVGLPYPRLWGDTSAP